MRRIDRVVQIAALLALAGCAGVLLAQTATRFAALLVTGGSELRGSITNTAGNVTVNDDLDVTGALTVASCTGCGGGSSSGTFTFAFDSACTSTVSMTGTWVRIGDLVFLTVTGDASACTSNSTAFITTAHPLLTEGIIPNAAQYLQGVGVVNNGVVDQNGCLRLTTGGDVAVNRSTGGTWNCDVQTWTGSGTKRVFVQKAGRYTFVYNAG